MCGNGIGHQTWQRIMFNLARPWPAARTPKSSCHQFAYITLSVDFNFRNSVLWNRAAKSIFGPQGKRKLAPPPPPILQIMILKLSPPRCVISKESVQQKWIDELWFRMHLSTCLFVWNLNYNDLVHLLIDVFL